MQLVYGPAYTSTYIQCSLVYKEYILFKSDGKVLRSGARYWCSWLNITVSLALVKLLRVLSNIYFVSYISKMSFRRIVLVLAIRPITEKFLKKSLKMGPF